MRIVTRLSIIAVALFALAVGAGRVEAGTGGDDTDLVAAGNQLFLTGCASCHGVDGVGTQQGPPLIGVGAASADFQLRTGRMPAADVDGQPQAKDVAYGEEEIQALVAYVADLGDGPPIPDVDVSAGDLAEGGELYRANCAACHNAAGIGGALSYGSEAPGVLGTEPVQIAEAMRVGPGQMPVFGSDTFDEADVNSIVRHIRETLADDGAPGGFTLGSAGPVTEGFVAILIGLAGIVLSTRWITGRMPGRE